MLLLFLVLGCPKSRVQRDDGMLSALEAVDRAWRQRPSDGFEPVQRALEAARAIDASHPGVAWRTARLGVSRGLMAADRRERLRSYAGARDAAWQCVLDDTQVAGLRLEVGLTNALGDLEATRRPCAAWAAMAWSRWSLAFGRDAASLDRPRIDALIEAPTSTLEDRVLQQWSRALLDAGARDAIARASARAELSGFTRRQDDPTEGVALIDLYRWFDRGTAQDERSLALVTSKSPSSLEARAYRKNVLGGR